MATLASDSDSHQDIMELYGSYPFETDTGYQQGLATILAGQPVELDASSQVGVEMLRRTRVFYFNKVTGNNITVDDAREYESLSKTYTLSTSNSEQGNDSESQVLTFAELKGLIESGNIALIPNNKIIPDRLNEAPPSKSTVAPKRKPWESTT